MEKLVKLQLKYPLISNFVLICYKNLQKKIHIKIAILEYLSLKNQFLNKDFIFFNFKKHIFIKKTKKSSLHYLYINEKYSNF